MLSSLPNELINAVTAELAFIPPPSSLQPSCWIPQHLRFPCPSPALASLSMVNKHLRQICMPFLFAHVQVDGVESAQEFQRFWSTRIGGESLLKLTKVLSVLNITRPKGSFPSGQERLRVTQIVCDLLPFLGSLSYVNLTNFCSPLDYTVLQKAVDAIPSISAVVLGSTIDISGLPSTKFVFTDVYRCLSHSPLSTWSGLNICRLTIPTEWINEEFGTLRLENLHELAIILDLDDGPGVPYKRLRRFTSAHPQLKRLSFDGFVALHFFDRRAPPAYIDACLNDFISKLRQEHQHNLMQWIGIHHIGLTRIDDDSESSPGSHMDMIIDLDTDTNIDEDMAMDTETDEDTDEETDEDTGEDVGLRPPKWQVTELAVHTISHLVEILAVISDTLGDLQHFCLDLRSNNLKDYETAEESLAAACARFRQITILDLFQRAKVVPRVGKGAERIKYLTHIDANPDHFVDYVAWYFKQDCLLFDRALPLAPAPALSSKKGKEAMEGVPISRSVGNGPGMRKNASLSR
ncbi:hypothetical protein D9757_003246 [Collybiopsis confluens]|uniref:Uncharacterized protein n=1 Tax=Collybiopsis confluens TaxID=2823264 RepID=A0A8H5HYQ3_9AGAR|nr:hypothetical protein D9757_003246 [Collybiopsis confluens]